MANLANGVVAGPETPKLLIGTGKSDTVLLLVLTADRGLCGGFNTNISRLARERVAALVGEGKT